MTPASLAKYALAAYDQRLCQTLAGERLECGDASCSIFAAETVEKNVRVLAIQGTDSYRDVLNWIPDISRIDGIQFHRGSVEYARLVVQALKKHARNWCRRKSPLYIVGHSLGGAAALPLLYLLPDLQRANGIVTYGAPRAVRSGCGAKIAGRSRIIHVIRDQDPVPDLPFAVAWLPAGRWEHVGSKLWIDGSRLRTEVTTGWQVKRRMRRCCRYVSAALLLKLFDTISADHSMRRYAELLGCNES